MTKPRNDTITQSELKERLHYNPETGVFSWKTSYFPSKVGSPAGHNHLGYLRINLGGRHHLTHRLAWLYVTGEWPVDQLDHINGDKADNRFSNLREVDQQENNRNAAMRKDNISGVTGASLTRSGKWAVTVGNEYLGRFPSKNDAIEARKAAETRLGYHPNHRRGIVIS